MKLTSNTKHVYSIYLVVGIKLRWLLLPVVPNSFVEDLFPAVLAETFMNSGVRLVVK